MTANFLYCNASFSSRLTNSSPNRIPFQQSSCIVRCSSIPQHNKNALSRRTVAITLVIFNALSIPTDSRAEGALDKYVKRKKLDPLEVYVPPVILTQFQIKDLVKTLEGDQPQYASYRSILRSGPAASLRVNIRAVAQYASDDGKGKAATNDVDECLKALEDLDSLLLRASRNDQGASVEKMKAKIFVALGALDSLLQTVPTSVLDKGKAIADSYREVDDVEPQTLDPEMRRLESLL